MSANLRELLRQRYAPPAWAFLEEVRNQTGYGKSRIRTADALAMSLYPSRGLHLHGFEIKVSRADWKKELDDPSKAEEIAQFCHFWWLVIDDPKIVQNGELPATWGLLVRHGEKLKCEREPRLNEAVKPPDHAMVAAICRKAQATTEHTLLERARSEGHEKGFAEGKQWVIDNDPNGLAERRLEDLEARVDAFTKASGITLAWGHLDTIKKMGAAVRMLTGEWNNPLRTLEQLGRDAAKLVEQVDEVKREVTKHMPKLRDDSTEAA